MSDQQLTVQRLLAEHAAQYPIALSAAQLEQFGRYFQLLHTWNQRVNLTRIVEPAEIAVRHFLDSLSCIMVTGDLSGKHLIDVGSGAGFPGLPLKILFPELTLTLVESVGKKCSFLEAVVLALDLQQTVVVNDRAESIGQMAKHREQYDWATARAVARLATLVEYLLPLVRYGGSALAQKGDGAAAEVVDAQRAIAQLGGGEPTITVVTLPDHEANHTLVAIPKVAQTPAKYPRRAGIPLKRPL